MSGDANVLTKVCLVLLRQRACLQRIAFPGVAHTMVAVNRYSPGASDVRRYFFHHHRCSHDNPVDDAILQEKSLLEGTHRERSILTSKDRTIVMPPGSSPMENESN